MADEDLQDRRSFLRWACYGLGAVFSAILGFPALSFFIDPRNRVAADSAKRPVSGIKLSQVGAMPAQGVIRNVRRDAWTLHPNDVVGRVWVVRVKEGQDESCYRVFTTTCPHLGCSINCNTTTPVHFKCPCHDAEFHPDGTRVNRADYKNAAPRDMDSLRFEVARDPDNPNADNRDLLLVEFQTFTTGKPVKEVRS